MYCVYILFSEAYDRFYVGHTNSIERRIEEHNSGRNKSTSPYLPWRLIGVIKKPDKSSAVELEFKLRNLSKKRKIEFINKYVKEDK
ncbi:MAG: GIY-YIG nuclease family protein [Bacteroidetes bacterium]|nr:GIY-YIG nuclease family protein [Bacteroidota bacterium]